MGTFEALSLGDRLRVALPPCPKLPDADIAIQVDLEASFSLMWHEKFDEFHGDGSFVEMVEMFQSIESDPHYPEFNDPASLLHQDRYQDGYLFSAAHAHHRLELALDYGDELGLTEGDLLDLAEAYAVAHARWSVNSVRLAVEDSRAIVLGESREIR